MSVDRIPVFWLTARQFLEGRSIRVVALLAAVPLLLGIIEIIAVGTDLQVRNMLGQGFQDLTIPTLLPLIALILASSALGNEISDRTLLYLALKPWSRIRIVLEKYAATISIGILIAIVLVFAAWALLGGVSSNFDGELLLAMMISIVLAIGAYAAAFTLLSLLITRVLMAGLLYVLIWESLLAQFIPGLRLLSIQHYVTSVYANVLADGSVAGSQLSSSGASVIVLITASGVFIILTWLRLQQMDLD